MARINNISTLLQGISNIAELRRFVADAFESTLNQVNGKLDFGDNVRTFGPVTVEFSNTLPTKITHGLGRTPIGYFVTNLNAPAIVYSPNRVSFPWTSTQIYLQSDTADIIAGIMLF